MLYDRWTAAIEVRQRWRRELGANLISANPTDRHGTCGNHEFSCNHVLHILVHLVRRTKTKGAPSTALWEAGMQRRESMRFDDCAEALGLEDGIVCVARACAGKAV
jgi:hypothetical protein